MASPALPPTTALSTMPVADQLKIIDTLFEPSPDMHNLLRPILSDQTFTSYNELVDAIHSQMSALSATSDPREKEALYRILGAHPRLGASSPAAQAHLSELSRREQANINQSTDEAARLSSLNAEYEEKYPGLRYVYVACSMQELTQGNDI